VCVLYKKIDGQIRRSDNVALCILSAARTNEKSLSAAALEIKKGFLTTLRAIESKRNAQLLFLDRPAQKGASLTDFCVRIHQSAGRVR
jgi:hypothetical protein